MRNKHSDGKFQPLVYPTTVARNRLRMYGAILLACWTACGGNLYGADASGSAALPAGDYREPSAAVIELLTAQTPPQPLLHASTGHVALLFREPVITIDRIARPRLGLAGFRFDPISRISGVEPLVKRVEVIKIDAPRGSKPIAWQPAGGALLEHVHFAPDGQTLSAVSIGNGPARLVLFDVRSQRERILPAPVNTAWGNPCNWISSAALLCRLIPENIGEIPSPRPAPIMVEHGGGEAPIRTYTNLLENTYEDALFDYYFRTDIGRVDVNGAVQRAPGLSGLFADVEPSPDGSFAVVERIQPPYPRLVPARQFPSAIEVWDLASGERRYASSPQGFGVEEEGESTVRRFTWKPGSPATLGWVEKTKAAGGGVQHRWMAISASPSAIPVEIAHSEKSFKAFGWTSAMTPIFGTSIEDGAGVRFYVVLEDGPKAIGDRNTADRYGNPGRAVRVDGFDGPVLEVDGRIFLAGDGQSPGGPQPFLDALDLRSLKTQRLFTAAPGVFETVLGVLDPERPVIVTSRETETDPPNLYVRRGASRTALRPFENPYPQLAGVTRRVLTYKRADGVDLSGTLYLPAGRREGERLPTLVWIYPYEFSDQEQAEQIDIRAFSFHKVKGPSPLAAVVEGYAVLLNPTVPIIYEEGGMSNDYIPQLVASLDAAVDHLVGIGVTDPARVAVGGRSYGAFSSANLLIHSNRFATAIAMSGAYNRTLTPFGFQHEKRSFWEATDLYTSISPFFHANRIKVPLLLVHGGGDENPGTPPLQARRLFHALVGEGAQVRYVELPYEGHHYWARENVLHASAEMLDWLARTIKAQSD